MPYCCDEQFSTETLPFLPFETFVSIISVMAIVAFPVSFADRLRAPESEERLACRASQKAMRALQGLSGKCEYDSITANSSYDCKLRGRRSFSFSFAHQIRI